MRARYFSFGGELANEAGLGHDVLSRMSGNKPSTAGKRPRTNCCAKLCHALAEVLGSEKIRIRVAQSQGPDRCSTVPQRLARSLAD